MIGATESNRIRYYHNAKRTHVVARPYRLTTAVLPAARPATGVPRPVWPTHRADAVRPPVHPVAGVVQRAVRLTYAAGRLSASVPLAVRPVTAVPPTAVFAGHVQSSAVSQALQEFAAVPTAFQPFYDAPALGQTVV